MFTDTHAFRPFFQVCRKSAVLTPACQVLKCLWNDPAQHNALFMSLLTGPFCATSFFI